MEKDKYLLPEIVRQILARRGYHERADIEAFLAPDYEKHLHNPFLLTDMDRAVDRIVVAAENRQKVVVYGDYDIDGLTASVVLIEALASLGIEATSYIPDRFEEGYGINLEALKKLKKTGVDLIISVDCGSTSVTEATWAREHRLDLIITDHHAVPETEPEVVAFINPKRAGDEYPFKDLAGVGVAFKLVQALQKRVGKPEAGQEKWLLDLVALGTVCDVVALTGENRTLAHFGLRVLRRGRRAGLVALAAVGGVETTQLHSYHLGFVLGPRLNAAGRLEHAARSLALLQCEDKDEAWAIAEELDSLNATRRTDQAKIQAEALERSADMKNDAVLVLADPEWSQGIVGIVASKLVEYWHKPVLIMQIMGEGAKGSARSLGQFNLVEALRAVDYHFTKFGGHHFAAGFTLPTAAIDGLRADLNAYARESYGASLATLYTPPEAEVLVGRFGQLDRELYQALTRLEPFGNANPKPLLGIDKLKVVSKRVVGSDGRHLKLHLADSEGVVMEGIGFGLAEEHANVQEGQVMDVIFELTENNFNGVPKLELNIKSLK